MKTIILWCICFILLSISCKDKPESEPLATANINDILGAWVSVDSSITERDGKFFYARDTLFVKKDTLVSGHVLPIYIICTGRSEAYYSGSYFGMDSLVLSYLGPSFINIPNNNFRHKVLFNNVKDTISIINFKTTYPYSNFNKFYKK